MTDVLLLTFDGMEQSIYDRFVKPHMDYDISVSGMTSSLPPTTTPATHVLQTGYDGSYTSVYDHYSRAQPDDEWLPSDIAVGCRPLETPTFFEALDRAGYSTLTTWVPNSYPAQDYALAHSWVLGGLQGSSAGRGQLSATPQKLESIVGAEFGATMQEPGMEYSTNPWQAWRRSRDRLAHRLEATKWALDRLDPEFAWFYIFNSDQLMHWFHPDAWHPLQSPGDQHPDLFAEAMAYIAKTADRMIDYADPDNVVICSDHGFRPYSRKAHINAKLLNDGFLVPGDIFDGGMDPGNELLPHGVDPVASSAICRKDKVWTKDGQHDAVRKALADWRDPVTGDRIADEIVEPDYEGPFADVGPDLILVPATDEPGYDTLYPGLSMESGFADSVGAHSRTGIVGGDITADTIHGLPHAIAESFGVDLDETRETLDIDRSGGGSEYGTWPADFKVETAGGENA